MASRKVGSLSKYSPFTRFKNWLFLSSMLINIMALAMPLMMLHIYDRVIPHASYSTLTVLALGVLGVLLAEAGLRIVRSQMSAWSAARFEHQAGLGATSRLLAMPVHEFERQGTGQHLDRFRALSGLREYYSGSSFLYLVDLPFAILFLAVLGLIGSWILVIPLGGAIVFGLLTYGLGKAQRLATSERNLADQRRGSFLIETLNSIHTVKSMAMEALMLRRYERLQETSAQLVMRQTQIGDLTTGLASLFGPMMTLAVVAYGAVRVVEGDMTNGELAACTLLTMRSLAPLQRIGAIWGSHQKARALHEEVSDLFAREPLPPRAGVDATGAGGRIELKGVNYRFPGSDRNILEDVDFEADPGECVLIKGGNSSGRSTLLAIIQGVVKPDTGQVLLDGREITAYDPVSVRQAVAYLPQRAQLFEGTLMDSLTAYDPHYREEARELAEELQLDDFVSHLRRGYETVVGDAIGESLPIGHRQRIAIVRAMSHNPTIVLFDETNNAVDERGESAMLRFIQKIRGRATLVLVTQRPSFQKLADRTYCLREGRLFPDDGESDFQGRPRIVQLQTARAEVERPAAFHEGLFFPASDNADIETGDNTADRQRLRLLIERAFRQPTDFSVCLAPLLEAMKWQGDPRTVAEALPYFADTLDRTGMLNTMAQLGYHGVEIETTLDRVSPLLMPSIFVPGAEPAVVLLSRNDQGIGVHHHGLDTEVRIKPKPVKGTLLLFKREEEHEEQQAGPGWSGGTLSRFRPLFWQVMVGALIMGFLVLPMPLFVRMVYDRVIPAGSLGSLWLLAGGTAAALLLAGIFVYNRSRILGYISGRVDYLFGTAVLKHLLALPPSVSERSAVGSQVARIGSFEAIRDLFLGPVASAAMDFPVMLVFVVALAFLNPWALLVLGAAIGLYVILLALLLPATRGRVAALSKRSMKRNEFLIEMLSRMRTLREIGAEYRWLQRFREISAESAMAAYHAGKLSGVQNGLSAFIISGAGLGVLVLSASLAIEGLVTVGTVIISMLLLFRMVGPLQAVFVNLTRIESVRGAMRQLDHLMSMKGERVATMATISSRRIKGSIGFNRVSFRYSHHADPAVVGASFEIKPGEVVAITGPNGSGKSTLLKMMAGLYHPQAGSVRIDNVDIRQIDPVDLRRSIGYAPQECHLFFGTIAQNLRLVQPAATDDELRWAMERAGAWEDIQALPQGLMTRVGDGASQWIPEGLRQKISLARAYLTKAPILLFDEPSNGLDFAGDRLLMDTIGHLRGRKTVVFVTHRPSHVRMADKVLVFDAGQIRFVGSPDEVMKRLSAG